MKANDTNFIRRLQRHKPDALDYIVDTYLPLVKGTVIKVLGPLRNDGLIDECVNDSFLSVWQHADSFRGTPEDFRKWIYAIARFKAIDAYRKQIRQQAQVVGDAKLDILQAVSAEQELLLAEEQAEVMQLLHQLSDTDRDIFTMKYLLGMRTEDIAAKLGLTRTAVDNRVFRGKKKLQEKAQHMGLGGHTV